MTDEPAYDDEPDSFDGGDDGDEFLIECPFCDGSGESVAEVDPLSGCIMMDCPECGGTGWY